jgi:hypothetical protein
MSEEAILAEELVVSVLVEVDGKEVSIPLTQWLDQEANK